MEAPITMRKEGLISICPMSSDQSAFLVCSRFACFGRVGDELEPADEPDSACLTREYR